MDQNGDHMKWIFSISNSEMNVTNKAEEVDENVELFVYFPCFLPE